MTKRERFVKCRKTYGAKQKKANVAAEREIMFLRAYDEPTLGEIPTSHFVKG